MAEAPDPFEAYLKRATDLFEAGDIVRAGQIWQAILKKAPDHQVARAGLYRVKLYFDSRATQDGLVQAEVAGAPAAEPEVQAAPAPAVIAPLAAPAADPEINHLLDQGCTLYDAGHAQDAIRKWEQVLEKCPGHPLAKGYISGALRSLGQIAPEAEPAAPPLIAVAQPVPVAPPAEPESPRSTILAPAGFIPGLGPVGPPPVPQAPPVEEQPPQPAPAVPAELVVEPVPVETLDPESLLRAGCTLYDMGQVEESLKKWECILAVEPHHALALDYIRSARKELGLPPLEGAEPVPQAMPVPAEPSAPASPGPEAVSQDEAVERLLREGVQLYDVGMNEEAVQRWRQVLEIDPGHAEAAEYLKMAQPTVAPPEPEAPPAEFEVPALPPLDSLESVLDREVPARPTLSVPPPNPEVLELKLHQAGRLLQLQHFEEAAFAFQRILDMDPQNPQAVQGYQQARTLLNAQLEAAAQPPEPEAAPAPPVAAVQPPALVASRPMAKREGLALPGALKELDLPPWARHPLVLLGAVVAIVLINVGLYFLNQHRNEMRLKDEVLAARNAALKPSAQGGAVVDLTETPTAIRSEAEASLTEDPLRAYFRAEEALRLNPTDALAAQILERAKALLAAPAPNTGTLKDYERFLQSGDLETANQVLDGLLRQSPTDFDLRARSGRLCLATAQLYASKERWSEAREKLRRGRAMFPQEKIWQARLYLLEQIQNLPRNERQNWIAILG